MVAIFPSSSGTGMWEVVTIQTNFNGGAMQSATIKVVWADGHLQRHEFRNQLDRTWTGGCSVELRLPPEPTRDVPVLPRRRCTRHGRSPAVQALP
jgi:hypothetical protein